MRCPRCGSHEVEKQYKQTISHDKEGEVVNWRVLCLRCGHVFGFDELIPAEET